MAAVLIGYTGFIGSNLTHQREWDVVVNSSNALELKGHFTIAVCCAAPGTKWIANSDPEMDSFIVEGVLETLCQITAERLILISTADVFGQPVDADELDNPVPDCAYGKNRLWLETEVRREFPHAQIVRLPGVIGPGLKKNPYFDLQNARRLSFLNPDSVYQWYDVRNLWKDIRDRKEPIIHLCPKPESLSETVDREFPHLRDKLTGTGTPAKYNLRSIYG